MIRRVLVRKRIVNSSLSHGKRSFFLSLVGLTFAEERFVRREVGFECVGKEWWEAYRVYTRFIMILHYQIIK